MAQPASQEVHFSADHHTQVKVEPMVTSNEDDDYPLSPRTPTPNPFSRKNTSVDIDDYFVSRALRCEARIQPGYQITNLPAGRTARHLETLEMAALPPDARQYPAQDDIPSRCHRCLVDNDYRLDVLRPVREPGYLQHPSDGHRFRRESGAFFPQFHGLRKIRRRSKVLGSIAPDLPVAGSRLLAQRNRAS
jgi:hypothetical protein